MYKLLLMALIVSNCSLKNANNKPFDCDKADSTSADHIFQYLVFDADKVYLDSAMLLIDEMLINCDELSTKIMLRKLAVFSIQQKYQEGLSYIETFDKPIFHALPYYNTFLRKRFQAMQAEKDGRFDIRDTLIFSIYTDLDKFIYLHRNEVDSIWQLNDILSELGSFLFMPITQYFYYKSKVFGIEKTYAELDSIRISYGLDDDYFDAIKSTCKEEFLETYW